MPPIKQNRQPRGWSTCASSAANYVVITYKDTKGVRDFRGGLKNVVHDGSWRARSLSHRWNSTSPEVGSGARGGIV